MCSSDLASRREGPDQSPLDRALVRLWSQVSIYEDLQGAFSAFAFDFPLKGEELRALYGNKEKVGFYELLQKGREFANLVQKLAAKQDQAAGSNVIEIGEWLANYGESGADRIGFFPPKTERTANEKWLTVGEIIQIGRAHV